MCSAAAQKKPPRGGGGVGMDQTGESIGAAGFEPTTPTTPKWCATKLRYAPALLKLSQWLRPPPQGLLPFSKLAQQAGCEPIAAQAGIAADLFAARELAHLGQVEAG